MGGDGVSISEVLVGMNSSGDSTSDSWVLGTALTPSGATFCIGDLDRDA